MKRKIIVIDEASGEVEREVAFDGGYMLQYAVEADAAARIYKVGDMPWGEFDDKRLIANASYGAIAAQLCGKFVELAHIQVGNILFFELPGWKPPQSGIKPGTWMARCCKAPNWLSCTWGYTHVIEVRWWFISRMSRAQVAMLIYHELRHIGVDGGTVPHDVAEWDNVLRTIGSRWTDRDADVADILGDDFGWREPEQMDLYRAMQDAVATAKQMLADAEGGEG